MTIHVSKPFLPPLQEYMEYLDKIWQKHWLTNNGPLVQEFEQKLRDYLGLNHLCFVTNGTQALQFSIRALKERGEIITTSLTHIATASSIVWEGYTPVIVDIDPETLTLDVNKIEAAITDKTRAILAVHIFGVPCEVEKIEVLAKRYNLVVIYDAAHAFGTRYKGQSLFAYGDIVACSFHATKLFHTIEGGVLMTSNSHIMHNIQLMRNFGQSSLYSIEQLGINGKNSEFHAAMGLCCFRHLSEILAIRALLYSQYLERLSMLPLRFQKIPDDTDYNHAYFPVMFETETDLLRTVQRLNDQEIFPRRYFYPALSQVPYLAQQKAPIAEDISRRMLCLPLYHDLLPSEVDMICSVIHLNFSSKSTGPLTVSQPISV